MRAWLLPSLPKVNKEDKEASDLNVCKFQQNPKTMIPITPNPNSVNFTQIDNLDFSTMGETLKKMEVTIS